MTIEHRSVTLPVIALIAVVLAVGMHVRGTEAAIAAGDEQAHKLLMLALDNIHRGMCGSNQRCAPATAEEKTSPPITIAEAGVVISRAALSAAAEHCGLDWKTRNFVPMMAYWRQTIKKNERQMALIAILHGLSQEFGKQGFKSACTDEMRQNIDRQLTFRS